MNLAKELSFSRRRLMEPSCMKSPTQGGDELNGGTVQDAQRIHLASVVGSGALVKWKIL